MSLPILHEIFLVINSSNSNSPIFPLEVTFYTSLLFDWQLTVCLALQG